MKFKLTTIIVSILAFLLLSSNTAYAGSIFDGKGYPQAVGSGWTQCEQPVEWFVDFGSLNKKQKTRELENLSWAFRQWAKISDLNFVYGGEQDFNFNDTKNRLYSTSEKATTNRTVFVSFLDTKKSTMLRSDILGFGGPILVYASKKEIIHGNVVLKTEYVKEKSKNYPKMMKSLYLHEIGHVLGLPHNSSHKKHIMHPEVSDTTKFRKEVARELGELMQPCISV